MADGQLAGCVESQGEIGFAAVDATTRRVRLLQPKAYLALLNGITWLFVCVSLLRVG